MGLIASLAAAGVIFATLPSSGIAMESQKNSSDKLMAACPLRLYRVSNTGVLIKPPILYPNDIASLTQVPSLNPDYAAMRVMVKASAQKKLWLATSKIVGKNLRVFCGEIELTSPTVLEPFKDDFLVTMPRKSP